MPVSDQGAVPGRFMVIPRTLIFLTSQSHVLLLRGAKNKRLWANRYNGIGGHIEAGEDVLSAAHRELREESSLECADLSLCGTVMVDAGSEIGICLFVLRGILPILPDLKSYQTAEGSIEWVPFDQVYDLPLVEDLPTLLPRVLAAQPVDPPFAARYSYDDNQRLIIAFSD